MVERHSKTLGENCLKWCDNCNLPILDLNKCPECHGPTREVDVTPPCDITPSFRGYTEIIRKTFNKDFGEGSGDELIKNNPAILTNKIFTDKRRCEIIFDGCPAAYLIYNSDGSYSAENTLYSASIIANKASKKVVTCGRNPGRMVEIGRNLMAPGVVDVSPDIQEKDEVIIRDVNGKAVGLGIAAMSADEMKSAKSGMAVKNKKAKMPVHSISARKNWDAVIKANSRHIEKMVKESIRFMINTINDVDRPAVISFSGGKDSEAVLLLSVDGNLNLPILYVNTGLYSDETTELTHYLAEKYNLKLIEKTSDADVFFENMKRFGPPAIGHRWCCKTNRLTPTFAVTNEHFPEGSLSFIGQRKYESLIKMKNSSRWVNKWVPSNICASPIQDWSALHVWMYIFMRKVPYNIWYERGLGHISCLMCPASSLQTIRMVEDSCEKAVKWKNAIVDYQKSKGLPDEWVEYGLWRWKRIPAKLKADFESATGKTIEELTKRTVADENNDIKIVRHELRSQNIEAALSRPVDIMKLSSFAKALGESPMLDINKMQLSVGNLSIDSKGTIKVIGTDESAMNTDLDKMYKIVIRSERCIGCSSCALRCPTGALFMKDGIVQSDPSKCISCMKCFGPCPSAEFKETDLEK